MSTAPRRRSMFTRRIKTGDDSALPIRNYRAKVVISDVEEWRAEYDLIGNNVVGTLFKGSEICRKTFIVKLISDQFSVDTGTGSDLKIKFEHKRR